ncbi:PREDICTED: uncharacterized protein LOC108565552 [Nicrophorus vespilloides]|uniref:Uncharacterized protein LOC108565552 n=1 Tax=Nicrophorus vespilloides TaxID=110193 RepID=A0ABM1N170_NICVS|nr:PREDICTED: uncharacterized protein LOC108565552 [Nicrophorus vespilloides]
MSVDLKQKAALLFYTKDDVDKILATHGKKLKDVEVDLKTIKEWFKTQPHIPELPSDRLIVSYLIMNKFHIEKTKSRLEMNYSIRNVMPELFCHNPLDLKIRDSHRYFKVIGMSKLTKDLRRLFIVKPKDDACYDITIIISRLIMSLELLTTYDINNGDEYIIDYANVNLSMITKTKPTDVMKILGLAEIFVHKNVELLKEYYSLDMLPKDYGGTAKSIDELSDDFQEFLESHDEYLSKWIQIRVDAKMRPEPLVNDEILGYYGNFKSLDVD